MSICATQCERRIATACPYPSVDTARRQCARFALMVTVVAPVMPVRRTATKRERPADGGVVWHEELNAFQCYGCLEFEEIHKRADRTPDRLEELKELLIIEHTECWQFDDPRMAADARKYRSEKKRRENLKARVAGALDRQSVSWRGR